MGVRAACATPAGSAMPALKAQELRIQHATGAHDSALCRVDRVGKVRIMRPSLRDMGR